MGAPMATKMTEWPGGVTVYDIRTEAMTPLAEKGASLADSVADVAAADIIHVTVLDDAQVREVVGELAAHAKPGTVIAIHSTISDTTAVGLASDLKQQGIHIVDAPVSGGAAAAAKGELATMVGADREVYERIKPAFKHWASVVIHAGEPGAGTRMKLARNMLTFTSYAAACEAMKLAEAARAGSAGAGPGGAPHRRPHRRARGDHGPRRHERPSAGTLPLPAVHAHPRPRREGPEPGAGAWARRYRSTCRWPGWRYEGLAAGLGVPHTEKEA